MTPPSPLPTQTGRQLAKRLLKEHVKPYRSLFTLACLFMIIAAAATAALPYLLQPVFDRVFYSRQQPTSFYFFRRCFLIFFL